MGTLKTDSDDIILDADGSTSDVIFEKDGTEMARVANTTGVLSSPMTTTDITNASDDVLVNKGYLNTNLHEHTNKTVLDNTTASYLSAEDTKIISCETNATADRTQSELNAKLLNADKLNSTYNAHLSTATGLGTSNSLVSSQNAVKVYNDTKVTSHVSTYHPSTTRPAFWAIRNSTLWIPNDSAVHKITWNSVYNDQSGDFSLVSHGFVVPHAGYYRVNGMVTYASHLYAANDRIDSLVYVDTTVKAANLLVIPNAYTYILSVPVNWEGYCSAGQTIYLYARIYSGYSGNNLEGSYAWNSFSGHEVSHMP